MPFVDIHVYVPMYFLWIKSLVMEIVDYKLHFDNKNMNEFSFQQAKIIGSGYPILMEIWTGGRL